MYNPFVKEVCPNKQVKEFAMEKVVSIVLILAAATVHSRSLREPNDISSEIFKLKDRVSELEHLIKKGGYQKFSAQDLQWQSLHMAAAAACRGSTLGGGSGQY